MSETSLTTGYVETPMYFEAGDHTLFGVLTMPPEGRARTGLIILPGAGSPLTVNRNRISVRICREITAFGYAGFRMDYHGVGDSTGSVEEFRLDRPFVKDVAAAVGRLRALGVERVVLVGSCFGARTALSAAEKLDNIDAVILIASALRDYKFGEVKPLVTARSWSLGRYLRAMMKPSRIKGLFDRRMRRTYGLYARSKLRFMAARVPGIRRTVASKATANEEVSPAFERPLRALVARGVAVRFVFGAEDGFYTDEFRTAAAGTLADVLDERRGVVQLAVLPGRLHGFTTLAVQDAVVDEIVGWVADHPVEEGRATADAGS